MSLVFRHSSRFSVASFIPARSIFKSPHTTRQNNLIKSTDSIGIFGIILSFFRSVRRLRPYSRVLVRSFLQASARMFGVCVPIILGSLFVKFYVRMPGMHHDYRVPIQDVVQIRLQYSAY